MCESAALLFDQIVLRAFRRGADTVDMARAFDVSEADCERALSRALDREYLERVGLKRTGNEPATNERANGN